MTTLLQQAGPFTDPDYTPEFGVESLVTSKILVLGAGGLGCEILKNLALSGFRHIECIDMDTIEISNLNRQFLFRPSDVGKSKAIVACEFVSKRVSSKELTIVPHFCKIQDFDDAFYSQFSMIVCGLDSIGARRWMNEKLITLAATTGQLIPWVDGGTEGFQGSVKLMIPTITACFECYMKLVPVQTTYPLCTLASTPRLPEHCIEWAHQLEWSRIYPDSDFNADIPDHVEKMYQLAKARATQFGIDGVTKSKTLGVVKNIIPAIAATNAVVAAACCHECFKFITSCAENMRDSMYYNGETGVVCVSDPYDKVDDCKVCGSLPREHLITDTTTLQEFVDEVSVKFSLEQPLFFTVEGDLYNAKSPSSSTPTSKLVNLLPFANGVSGLQVNVVDTSTPETYKLIPRLVQLLNLWGDGIGTCGPVGWANLTVLLGELEGLDESQGLLDVSSDWQVVDGGLSQNSVRVDQEDTSKSDSLVLEQDTVVLRKGVVLVGDQWDVDLSKTTIGTCNVGPGEQSVLGVGGSEQNLNVFLGELLNSVRVGNDFGWADESECHWDECEQHPLTLVLFKGDVFEHTVNNGGLGEAWSWLLDSGNHCIYLIDIRWMEIMWVNHQLLYSLLLRLREDWTAYAYINADC